MTSLVEKIRTAASNNDSQTAGSYISQFSAVPDEGSHEHSEIYDLLDFIIDQSQLEILGSFVQHFKHLSTNGRRLAKHCLYTSFQKGQMECAQSLQHFFPSEVFFCLSHATQNDHVHMLEHFLPPFKPDATDVTGLLIIAWGNRSQRCFDYLLPQCAEVDTHEVERRFGTRKEGVEFAAYVAAQRQKIVLLGEVAEEGRPLNRKM